MKRIFEKIFSCDHWNIGIAILNDKLRVDEHTVRWFSHNNLADFKADPFVIEHDGFVYIFYEELYLLSSHGVLRCAVFDKNLNLINDQVIHGFSHLKSHLSFPFTFKYHDKIFCIPETHELNRVVLFEAVDFPFYWREVKTLLKDIELVDTIFFELNSKCYLVGSDLDNKMFFFESDDLFDSWSSVKFNNESNIVNKRMGGGPIIFEGKLFFVNQECDNKEYGKAIYISEVGCISADNYMETIKYHILPFDRKYCRGIHTLNFSENYLVIDGKMKRYSLFMPVKKLICKFKTFRRKYKLSRTR
ncbi:glucosamine inositolphosphorylceramide transferase family protein [Edwardsiella tarda]